MHRLCFTKNAVFDLQRRFMHEAITGVSFVTYLNELFTPGVSSYETCNHPSHLGSVNHKDHWGLTFKNVEDAVLCRLTYPELFE